MNEIVIKGGDLVLPGRVMENTPVVIEGDRIAKVGGEQPKGAEVVDAFGCYVLPGLIDIHTHGRLGLPTPGRAGEDLIKDCEDLPASGVTRFLPTLASAPLETWHEVLAELKEVIEDPPVSGAVPMGVHLEGIFINPGFAGAQPMRYIAPYDKDNPEHEALFAPELHVKLVSFAPEVPGNEDLIELCRKRGIAMGLCHSGASPGEVYFFADAGVTHVIHLWNGMKGIHHRDPGPALAALLDDRLSVELICDGHHLHPEVVRLAHRMKPKEKRVLVTDSLVLDFPGVKSGGTDEPNILADGRIAGSRLRMITAVRNYAEFTRCPLHEAVAMASINPARVVGMDRELGSIEEGKAADLLIARKDDLEVRRVFVGSGGLIRIPSL